MPFSEDTTCPFCGARFSPGASACPACDLPLLGEDGSRPPEREPAPFDGASLFDETFPGEEFLPQRSFEPPLATERRSREGGDSMRCVVVAMNRAEAEMLEDMLRAEGVPCMVRTIGSEQYSSIGYRCEVMVPEFALGTARQLLRIEEPAPEVPSATPFPLPLAIAIGLFLVAVSLALISAYS
ncbi:MAG: putative signal transducing protein [Solirubrobacterales bacterium]